VHSVRIKMTLLGLAVLLLVPALAAAEPVAYKADPAHSSLAFTIRHFVSDVDGRFRDFDGVIQYDAQNPASSSVQFTVQAASISTENDDRDKHLKSPDFFDVAKFPTLSFTSTKVVAKGGNSFDVTGNLTLHGVTKVVTIPATFRGTVKLPKGEKAGFQSTFTLNRLDYGVAWNRAIEGGGAMLGDEVTVNIKIEANRQMAGAPGK
jgi:polyisoprenoid-binding protein YceI